MIAGVLAAGFNLDLVDDDVLRQRGRVEAGRLRIGRQSYRAVILPNVERIPLDTLRRLQAFARGGGVLLATRRLPEAAPGLQATPDEQDEVRRTVRDLFLARGAPAHFAEDENASLAPLLAERLRPDVSLQPPVAEIGFVHRRLPGADVYFLANTSNRGQRVLATFRVRGSRAEWWDPLSGRAWPAAVRSAKGGAATVDLEMEPYASRFLVFGEAAAAAPPPRAPSPAPAAIDLSTGWKVRFGPGGPAVDMDPLRSWTDAEATRFFSGVATYERTITVPAAWLQEGLEVRLELGEPREVAPVPSARLQAWIEAPVREAAVVFVNGRRVGSVWSPPYTLDVTAFLRPGANDLRVEVGNLAINHMAGRALPDYRLLNLRYGTRFEPQDMDKVHPVTAGLLGPIRLVGTPNAFPHTKLDGLPGQPHGGRP